MSIGRPPDAVIRKVRREFLELPGLQLTQAQAMRLWDMSGRDCFELLEHLVRTGFLVRRADGLYARPPYARMARASLSGGPDSVPLKHA